MDFQPNVVMVCRPLEISTIQRILFLHFINFGYQFEKVVMRTVLLAESIVAFRASIENT